MGSTACRQAQVGGGHKGRCCGQLKGGRSAPDHKLRAHSAPFLEQAAVLRNAPASDRKFQIVRIRRPCSDAGVSTATVAVLGG